jgi:hypothetical protein
MELAADFATEAPHPEVAARLRISSLKGIRIAIGIVAWPF